MKIKSPWDMSDTDLLEILRGKPKEPMSKVTLITLDGAVKTIEIAGEPDVINAPLYSDGRDLGVRVYKRDRFRDGEYRETPTQTLPNKLPGKLKTYKSLVTEMAKDFVLQGESGPLTVLVPKDTFNKIHREFSGKDAPKNLTFMEINADCKVFVRYAEAKGGTKVVLAEDLAALSLRDLCELKVKQTKKVDKTAKT